MSIIYDGFPLRVRTKIDYVISGYNKAEKDYFKGRYPFKFRFDKPDFKGYIVEFE
jgi:hypothetical protein